MSSQSFLKYVFTGAAMLGFAVLGGQAANAACTPGGNPSVCDSTAPVIVLAPAVVTETTQMVLGTVVAPTDTPTLFTLDHADSTVKTSGGDGSVTATGTSGVFAVAGTASASFVAATAVAGVCTGFAGGTLVLNSVTNNTLATGTFNQDVITGATFTVGVGTTAASGTCPFTLTITQP